MSLSHALSGMTLTQLAYLVAVDRCRSFREAASACHVTQPALSQQVQKIEDQLGLRIFDRSRQPVVPTEPGTRVLAQARVILREAERMADVLGELAGEIAGPYRLGIIPTLAPTLLPLFVPGFARRHPRVELVVEELQTAAMLARLADDTLDGGLASTPLAAPGIHERPLYREPFHVYLSSGHRLARRPRVAQAELASEDVWIMAEGHCFREQVLQLCGAGRSVRHQSGGTVRFESGNFETLVRLVDAGFGMTVLPDMVIRTLPAARRRSRVRPFAPPVPTREVSFVHSRDHLRRAIADALVAEIRDALPAPLVAAARREQRVLSPLASDAAAPA
ncbi:MAG: LysR substrate-binding domain-containing protein [Thermodesulfobacteriota bacterium]